MALTDPLGDMLTRIRNGQRARKDSVLTPGSKLRARVLDVLQREGYIRGYTEEQMGPAAGIRIELKYFEGRQPDVDRPRRPRTSLQPWPGLHQGRHHRRNTGPRPPAPTAVPPDP